MRKVLFVLFALCFVSSLAFAQDATQTATTATATDTAVTAPAATTPPAAATTTTETTTTAVTTTTTTTPAPETMTIKGYIIDNKCASANNKDTLGEFVKTHAKQCAITCMDSGYSIYTDGKLLAFDKDSNAKVVEFLKNADSKLQVTVTAKQVGDDLSLVSIENQQ